MFDADKLACAASQIFFPLFCVLVHKTRVMAGDRGSNKGNTRTSSSISLVSSPLCFCGDTEQTAELILQDCRNHRLWRGGEGGVVVTKPHFHPGLQEPPTVEGRGGGGGGWPNPTSIQDSTNHRLSREEIWPTPTSIQDCTNHRLWREEILPTSNFHPVLQEPPTALSMGEVWPTPTSAQDCTNHRLWREEVWPTPASSPSRSNVWSGGRTIEDGRMHLKGRSPSEGNPEEEEEDMPSDVV